MNEETFWEKDRHYGRVGTTASEEKVPLLKGTVAPQLQASEGQTTLEMCFRSRERPLPRLGLHAHAQDPSRTSLVVTRKWEHQRETFVSKTWGLKNCLSGWTRHGTQ